MGTQFRVNLTEGQRAELEKIIRSGAAPARVQTRARILLMADREGGGRFTDHQIAEAILVSGATVAAVRHRFVMEGLESALHERPRPGRTRKFTGEIEEKIAALAGSEPPAGHRRWSLRLLASELIAQEYVDTISHVAVARALNKAQPVTAKRGGGAKARHDSRLFQ